MKIHNRIWKVILVSKTNKFLLLVDLKDIKVTMDEPVKHEDNEPYNEENNEQQNIKEESKSEQEVELEEPDSPKSVRENPPELDMFIDDPIQDLGEGEDHKSVQEEDKKSDSAPSVRFNAPSVGSDDEADMNVDMPKDEPRPEYEEEIIGHEDHFSEQDDSELPIDEYFRKMLWKMVDSLVVRTEERIELMANLEQSKQKWILWGKQKAKVANKNLDGRKGWNVDKKKVSIRSDLEDVFRSHDEANKNTNIDDIFEVEIRVPKKSYLDTKSDDDVIVPLNLAIFQNIHTPIVNQAKIINRAFIHLFFRKLELLKHLENLRKIMFCSQGDLISNFTDLLFRKDVESSVRDPFQINNQLDMAIRTSLDEKHPLKDKFYFTSKQNQIWGITAFNMEEHFDIHYKVDYPLTLVFDEQGMMKYNKIFFFLIRLRRFNDLLKIIWNFTNSADLRKSPLSIYNKIRKVQLLRQKMQHFVNNLMQYIMNEVIYKLWRKFNQNLNNIIRFEDILILHKEYLNVALDK